MNMSKSKMTICVVVFSVVFVIFSCYMWLLLQSQKDINMNLIQENTAFLQGQMQNNLIYRARELQINFSVDNDSSLFVVDKNIFKIKNLHPAPDIIYIADSNGFVYKQGSKLSSIRLSPTVLKNAAKEGYATVSVAGATSEQLQVAFVVPLFNASNYYIVEIFTPEHFTTLLWNNFPVKGKSLALFDESGVIVNVLDVDDINTSIHSLLVSKADGHRYTQSKNSTEQISIFGVYLSYIAVPNLQGWFVGEYTDYSKGNFFQIAGVATIMVIFLAFIIIVVIHRIRYKEQTNGVFLNTVRDQLTGLFNPVGMESAVNDFSRKNKGLIGYSIVCMDIVEFRRINAMFGYSVGDTLLKSIATTIKGYCHCVARTNADLFTFLIKFSDNMVVDIETKLNNTIKAQLGEKYVQMVEFKFGIYPIEDAKKNFREIYDGALMALKDAKKQPAYNVVIYDKQLQQSLEFKKKIEVNMMHALSKEEFLFYVQPQINISDGTCTQGEALMRWDSETMGFISPDSFVSIFENNGFIVETDFFMLTKALELLEKRKKEGLFLPVIAVNQSRVTLSFPNYYERLESIIKQFSIPANYIELEITESMLEKGFDNLLPLIKKVKTLGFTVSMDDFGAGYSSLNTLRQLPIDVLKIDRAFLFEADTSTRSRQIIKSIIDMAKSLGIRVICEGVETQAHMDFLRGADCDMAQGYFFSKPIPVGEFLENYLDNVKK